MHVVKIEYVVASASIVGNYSGNETLQTSLCALTVRGFLITVYLGALMWLTPWFFAFDHTNYDHWSPDPVRDMAELFYETSTRCQRVWCWPLQFAKKVMKFVKGRGVSIDQAHEQKLMEVQCG